MSREWSGGDKVVVMVHLVDHGGQGLDSLGTWVGVIVLRVMRWRMVGKMRRMRRVGR